jgi:NADPH2:quinone reductase
MAMVLPTTMRAARYPTAGDGAGAIRVERVTRPDPAAGEVLVAVSISGVNPTDWKARGSGGFSSADDMPWVIPNQDGAGTIVACGDGVAPGRVGERVWLWQAQWRRPAGTAAEYVTVPAEQAVRLPDGASLDLGAGLGIPAMTAHRCLFADGPVASSDRVLVHGGAGAVGHAAIQLAVHAGASVAATVSSPEKGALASAAGAELVVDYRRDDVAEALRGWAPGGVRRIVEVDLARNLATDAAVIAPAGVIAVYAQTSGAVVPPRELMQANAGISFMLVYTMPDAAKLAAVEGITAALRHGALVALPSRRFTLDETQAAHDAVERGAVGKVLIDVGTPAS